MYTLGQLAKRVTGGNLVAMAKLANDAGAGIWELEPDPNIEIPRGVLVELFALRAGDRVGRVIAELLRE